MNKTYLQNLSDRLEKVREKQAALEGEKVTLIIRHENERCKQMEKAHQTRKALNKGKAFRDPEGR